MNTHLQIALKIIKEQEQLMGPVAWYEAKKVSGLEILDQEKGSISIAPGADSRTVLDNLVGQYDKLFGRAAREVCKEAAASLIADLAPADVPMSLK